MASPIATIRCPAGRPALKPKRISAASFSKLSDNQCQNDIYSLPREGGRCAKKKAVEVIAIATCGASFTLLFALVIAILSANGLTIEVKPETGKERSVAL